MLAAALPSCCALVPSLQVAAHAQWPRLGGSRVTPAPFRREKGVAAQALLGVSVAVGLTFGAPVALAATDSTAGFEEFAAAGGKMKADPSCFFKSCGKQTNVLAPASASVDRLGTGDACVQAGVLFQPGVPQGHNMSGQLPG